MKFRLHRGGLDDSMKTTVELPNTAEALLAHIQKELEYFAIFCIPANLKLTHYGIDNRTGWDSYLVTLCGKPVGFTDGPLEDEV